MQPPLPSPPRPSAVRPQFTGLQYPLQGLEVASARETGIASPVHMSGMHYGGFGGRSVVSGDRPALVTSVNSLDRGVPAHATATGALMQNNAMRMSPPPSARPLMPAPRPVAVRPPPIHRASDYEVLIRPGMPRPTQPPPRSVYPRMPPPAVAPAARPAAYQPQGLPKDVRYGGIPPTAVARPVHAMIVSTVVVIATLRRAIVRVAVLWCGGCCL